MMTTKERWRPMASSELENAQLFKFAESHQAVVLYPTTPGMILTIVMPNVDNSDDVLSPREIKVFQVRHVGVDVLKDTLVRR